MPSHRLTFPGATAARLVALVASLALASCAAMGPGAPNVAPATAPTIVPTSAVPEQRYPNILAVELLPDHAAEQPFTRQQSGVRIPDGVSSVTIQGRDKVYGYRGRAVTVAVPRRSASAAPTVTSQPTPPTMNAGQESATYALTCQRLDGNRRTDGRGALLGAVPLDIRLDGTPR
jgi:hypothetical protein